MFKTASLKRKVDMDVLESPVGKTGPHPHLNSQQKMKVYL